YRDQERGAATPPTGKHHAAESLVVDGCGGDPRRALQSTPMERLPDVREAPRDEVLPRDICATRSGLAPREARGIGRGTPGLAVCPQCRKCLKCLNRKIVNMADLNTCSKNKFGNIVTPKSRIGF